MSLEDWLFSEASTVNKGLSLSSIVDTYSLDLYTTGSGTNRAIAAYLVASPFTVGILRGRVSTIMRIRNNANNLFYGGLYCLASALTIASNANLYVLQVGKGTSNNVQLRKASSFNGILGTGTSGTQFGSSSSIDFSNIDDTVCVELEWDAGNQIGLGGTYLKASICAGTSLENLVTIVETVDSSSPLTTTTAEGIYMFQNHLTGSPTSIVYDQTRIYAAQ